MNPEPEAVCGWMRVWESLGGDEHTLHWEGHELLWPREQSVASHCCHQSFTPTCIPAFSYLTLLFLLKEEESISPPCDFRFGHVVCCGQQS